MRNRSKFLPYADQEPCFSSLSIRFHQPMIAQHSQILLPEFIALEEKNVLMAGSPTHQKKRGCLEFQETVGISKKKTAAWI